MPAIHIDFQQLILIVAVFVLTLSLWMIGLMIWTMLNTRREREIEKRLGLDAPRDPGRREIYLWMDGRLARTSVDRVSQLSVRERLDNLIRRAGWNTTPAALLLVAIGILALGGIAAFLWTKSLIVAAVAVIGIGYGLVAYPGICIARMRNKFENQLVDALGLATRSLRAGHPLIGAFQLIAQELPQPISRVFSEICQQQELGTGLDEAITRAVNRTNSDDLKFFATAVVIQLRNGGNLADMMERLSVVIRERMRLARRVRILIAQTQLSKNVLLAMPFVIFLMISVLVPEFAARLTDNTTGRIMLGVAGIGMLMGAWVMKRISTLRY
ncbi:MAG: type II secretion system F family protein [Candidatus Sumerlaeia bacterium]